MTTDHPASPDGANHRGPLAKHLVIVGEMGAGKTTVGRLVAAALGRPFIDNDAVLRERTGHTAAEIETAEGLDRLHELERLLFEQVLATPEPTVVAAAASVILGLDREALGDRAFVAFLHVSPEVLARRAAMGNHRPLPPDHLPELFDHLVAERDRLFEIAADVVVDADAATPAAMAERIVRALDPPGEFV